MPIVPTFQREDLPQIQQTGPQANLGVAGLPGEATVRLGDAATEYATKMIEAETYDWTANNVADFATTQNSALLAARKQAVASGDYKGAAQAFNQQLLSDQAARIAAAPTPRAADAFKLHSKGVIDDLNRNIADFADQGEWKSWQSNAQANLDKLATTSYQNPTLADTNYGLGVGIIKGAQAAGIGGDKVDWTQLLQSWGKQNYGAVVRHQIDTDPAGALKDLQGGKYGFVLNPDEVENFSRGAQVQIDRIQQKQLMAEQRALTMEARQDAMAARQLRQTQASNEATLLADAYQGKPIDTNKLADAVRSQQISPEGATAIMRGQEGRDDPATSLHLWKQLGDGNLQPTDIMSAVASHAIKASTGVELQRGLNEREKTGDNQVERTSFETLKTALDGHAIESGLDLFGGNRAQAAALWTQAQGEWNRRVIINHQDPNAVLSDMIPRYSPKANLPTWLPQPQVGAITSPDQVPVIWQQTKAALAAGRITPDGYQEQAALLMQYQNFFDMKTRRDAAATAAKQAGKPSAPGQQPVLTPAQGDQ